MKIALITLGILILLISCIFWYYGYFNKIRLELKNQGGEIIAYENVTGDYQNTAKYTDKIYYSLLDKENIRTTKGIGIFYDNPKHTDKDKLRSEVGCIIDNPNSTIISELSKKHQIKKIETKDYVVAEFPLKGKLSIIFGIMKVHPALNKYCEENGLKDAPITEIYDTANKKTIFRKEVIK